MIGTATKPRVTWLTTLGLGALGALLVFWVPTGLSAGRMTHEAAVEYCRAEVTRGFLVKYQSTGHRTFTECMQNQGY